MLEFKNIQINNIKFYIIGIDATHINALNIKYSIRRGLHFLDGL